MKPAGNVHLPLRGLDIALAQQHASRPAALGTGAHHVQGFRSARSGMPGTLRAVGVAVVGQAVHHDRATGRGSV